MSPAVTCLIAARALARNAMRTALTALGLIIGVAAVIVMVAIGTGARTSIEKSYDVACAKEPAASKLHAAARRARPSRGLLMASNPMSADVP